MDAISKDIMNELKKLRIDVNIIKQNMIDPDTILTADEEKRFNEGLEEFKEGKTTSLENFEKEIENEN